MSDLLRYPSGAELFVCLLNQFSSVFLLLISYLGQEMGSAMIFKLFSPPPISLLIEPHFYKCDLKHRSDNVSHLIKNFHQLPIGCIIKARCQGYISKQITLTCSKFFSSEHLNIHLICKIDISTLT